MTMDNVNRKVIAGIFIASVAAVAITLTSFVNEDTVREAAIAEERITAPTMCRTITETTTSTTTSSTTTETTTTVTTTEQVITETVTTQVPEPDEQIGSSGILSIEGYEFEMPIDSPYVYNKCAEYGVDPKIMYGIMMAESTMGTTTTNLCGITDIAAQAYNEETGNEYYDWETDPYQNVSIAAFCLKGAYDFYGNGSTYDALAGYNCGYWGHATGEYSSYAESVLWYAEIVY